LVREISALLTYEATQDFKLRPVEVETPLTKMNGQELDDSIGLIPVLRAGLGMVEGVWELMPSAEVWHIGLYRDERTLKPVEYYNKLPLDPTVSVCMILDPMLATGGSASATVTLLKKWGAKRISYLGLIAAPEGVARLQKDHPDVPIYLAALDDHLNEHGYIVPGLGDAGDRQFGTA
jgi:uracil phosphoribosyltransferase